MVVHRPRSDHSLQRRTKEIDMNLAYGSAPPNLGPPKDPSRHLAYGNEPPDLESRTDLTPVGQETQARTLMQRIEGLLTEAQCLHHTASAIISHLQRNPEAAAAVALTLAELSALLAKMSPAFLGVVQGGSPAVFALLASPQFLIGAGVAVGVTVVMFGGWKIIKRVKEAQKQKEANDAGIEMQPTGGSPGPQPPPPQNPGGYGFAQGAAYGAGYDEALVLEEELSTIDSWRRGIPPFGENETADLELISPEAEKAMRERHRDEKGKRREKERTKTRDFDEISPEDSASSCGRTSHSGRTGSSSRAHRSGSKSHRSSRSRTSGTASLAESLADSDRTEMVPERRSSKGFRNEVQSVTEASSRVTADRRSSSHRGESSSSAPKPRPPLAIEYNTQNHDNTLDAVLRKDKKPNMLKSLFKKKKEKELDTAVSA
jgi:hypothetical protein